MDLNKLSRVEKRVYDLERIQELVDENNGLVRTVQITDLGIDYRRILSFMEDGDVIRVKNGYYTTKSYKGTEDELIVQMFPDGVFTMQTALYFYGYLENKPYAWHIAVDKNTSRSRFKIEYPNVESYYTEPKVMELGLSHIEVAGHEMGIFTKERVICDCLKYQDKMDREDFKKGLLAYIADDTKDVGALMEIARERKVLNKVQNMIGVWL
ncbi:MAG: type IV toxin-antitoxin system AbiEi family antitoxin domain-containing protein [Lachnospiraceae bacterium]|nr:type IV toxin-antitoxin system AbiEi family antitoxin domain-containing protein [Lachnospiraceae bacterium]